MKYSTLFFTSTLALLGCSSATTSGSGGYQNILDYEKDIPNCIKGCYQFLTYYYDNTCDAGRNFTCSCLTPEPDLNDPELGPMFQASVDCMKANCTVQDQTAFEDANSKLGDSCSTFYEQYGPQSTAGHSYYESQLGTAHPTMGSQSGTPTGAGPTGTYTGAPTGYHTAVTVHQTGSSTGSHTGGYGASGTQHANSKSEIGGGTQTDSVPVPSGTGSGSTSPNSTVTASSQPTDSGNTAGGGSSGSTGGTTAGGAGGAGGGSSSTSTGSVAQQTGNTGTWSVAFNWEMTVGLPIIISLVLAQLY